MHLNHHHHYTAILSQFLIKDFTPTISITLHRISSKRFQTLRLFSMPPWPSPFNIRPAKKSTTFNLKGRLELSTNHNKTGLVGDSRDSQGHGTLPCGKRDPYELPIYLAILMGIVWETYHKGVPLERVPENSTEQVDDGCDLDTPEDFFGWVPCPHGDLVKRSCSFLFMNDGCRWTCR